MAVPRNRHSNARKNSKRAHHAKKPKTCVSCNNCGESKLSHVICTKCGFYADRAVVTQEQS
ncbi:MAG: 50S ribosomal protein L32 [Parachlamydiaceae bacterium]|nr:50S ribosomal protein L32 [Parachlamydiaceae bacterium]